MVPSTTPLFVDTTAWVVTVTTALLVTEEVHQTLVPSYEDLLATIYGVDSDDVTSQLSYETSGTMQLSISGDNNVTEAQVVEAVRSSVAASLGVSASNVTVTVDMEIGEVDFIVSSDSFEVSSFIQSDFENVDVRDAIISTTEESISELNIDEFQVSEDTRAKIEFTIDADGATNDLAEASSEAEEVMSHTSFEYVHIETTYVTHSFTSTTPLTQSTTSLPTTSITGDRHFFNSCTVVGFM